MKRRKLKRMLTIAFALVLLCTGFPVQAAEEQIKISDKEYAIVLNDAANAFIGNKTPMSGVVGTKVFLTYTVHKVNSNYATQDGVIGTTNVSTKYPSTYGCQIWSSGTRLFQEGYTYIFRLERTEEGFAYQALKMKDDKVANIQFTKGEATSDKFTHYGIWTGGTGEHTINAVLSHVRCYDENGKDLGLKSNLDPTKVKIYEDGEVEDYATVSGGYFCEENDTLLVLNDQKVAYKDNGTKEEELNYKILYGTQMSLMYPEGKEIWNYTHLKITDDKDNVYRRLLDAKVTFVNGEQITVKEANADNRYRVEKPEDPTKKDNTFIGWYKGDDTEYKFDSFITESITLYAKWRDGDGHEYLAVNAVGNFDYEPIIAISISVLVLAGLVAGYMILVKKRRNRNDKA